MRILVNKSTSIEAPNTDVKAAANVTTSCSLLLLISGSVLPGCFGFGFVYFANIELKTLGFGPNTDGIVPVLSGVSVSTIGFTY